MRLNLFDKRTYMLKPATYVGLGLLAALFAGFGMVADEVLEGDTLAFDNAVLMLFRQPGQPDQPIGPSWVTEAVRDLTSLGSYSVLTLIVVLTVGYLLLAGRKATALLITVAVVGGSIISTVLKAVIDRPRPDLTGVVEVFTASFPSGHSVTSAVTYLTIGAVLAGTTQSWRMRIFYVGAATFVTLLVGLTRLYLGVHYPTDVVAGWCLGAAWALLCFMVGSALDRREVVDN